MSFLYKTLEMKNIIYLLRSRHLCLYPNRNWSFGCHDTKKWMPMLRYFAQCDTLISMLSLESSIELVGQQFQLEPLSKRECERKENSKRFKMVYCTIVYVFNLRFKSIKLAHFFRIKFYFVADSFYIIILCLNSILRSSYSPI